MVKDYGRLKKVIEDINKMYKPVFGQNCDWDKIQKVIADNKETKRQEFLKQFFWDYKIEELNRLEEIISERLKVPAIESKPVKKAKTKGTKKKRGRGRPRTK